MTPQKSAGIPAREQSGQDVEGDFGEDRGMMDGKSYPLPETWTESSIGKAIVKAKQRDPRKKPDEVFQYVDVSAVSNMSFKITSMTPILGSEAPSRARKAIQTDDVLFATVRPTLKRIALVPPELDGAIASTGYCVLRCDKAKAEPGFLYSFLITDHFNARMAGLERGASYPAIRDSDVTASWFPLPPLPEQKKIAHILSTVQRAIEAQERIIQTTTELKKALMHKLFTEGLRHEPQKQTEIGPVPASWEVVRLDEIARIERGKFSHRPRNEPRFYRGEFPFVQTGDVANCDGYVRSYTQTLNEDGLAISKMFPAGTILITIAANIGFTGILQFDSACPDSLIGITPSERAQTQFLNYFLITQQPEMDRLAPKGTQKNINIQFLKPWPIPLPTVEEQEEIAGAFAATDEKIRLATAKRNELQDLFRTLLHELMTAKTRVHDVANR